MKKFFTWLWEGIKRGFMMFIVSTWYVWVALLIAFIIGWIFGVMVGVFTFFGIILAVIAYIFGRQIWWLISGTGDYEGRNGLLKRLWNKIFKK